MTDRGSKATDSSIKLLKKTKNTIGAVRSVGFRGVPGLIRTKLTNTSAQYISFEVDDLLGTDPLFRYATCNDMITLMGKYPQYCREDRDSTRSTVWGLKSMGTLFCVDKVVSLKPERVLEVGPGWNRHFDEHFGASVDYWMMDDASDIGWDKRSLEKFEQSWSKGSILILCAATWEVFPKNCLMITSILYFQFLSLSMCRRSIKATSIRICSGS